MSIARQIIPAGEGKLEVRDFDIQLAEIRLDQSAQPREALNNDRIAEYSEAMKSGDQFPALTVFHDGETYWLADGFHRHYAAQHAGRKSIRCWVRDGGLRDAILFSVGANAKHGLARSDEDKKRAIMRLLEDAEWSQWSDREIARRCRVSDKTVAKYRPAASADDPQIERKVQRGGTVYTQKVVKAQSALKRSTNAELAVDVQAPVAEPAAGTAADREFDALMSAWLKAGEGARGRFLAEIGATITIEDSHSLCSTSSPGMADATGGVGPLPPVTPSRSADAAPVAEQGGTERSARPRVAPVSDPLDPGPIPEWMDRRKKAGAS